MCLSSAAGLSRVTEIHVSSLQHEPKCMLIALEQGYLTTSSILLILHHFFNACMHSWEDSEHCSKAFNPVPSVSMQSLQLVLPHFAMHLCSVYRPFFDLFSICSCLCLLWLPIMGLLPPNGHLCLLLKTVALLLYAAAGRLVSCSADFAQRQPL